MERQPYPPPGSCVANNSQRPASVETVQGGVPPYGVKETVVVNGKYVWDIGVRFRVRISVVVRVRVSSFMDSFSVLLRGAQHYSIVTVLYRNHSVQLKAFR